jgi:hypothetical protein
MDQAVELIEYPDGKIDIATIFADGKIKLDSQPNMAVAEESFTLLADVVMAYDERKAERRGLVVYRSTSFDEDGAMTVHTSVGKPITLNDLP